MDANNEKDLITLTATLPVQIVVSEDWKGLAGNWVTAHAPKARFAALGKHMMFWDRASEFNSLLEEFLKDV